MKKEIGIGLILFVLWFLILTGLFYLFPGYTLLICVVAGIVGLTIFGVYSIIQGLKDDIAALDYEMRDIWTAIYDLRQKSNSKTNKERVETMVKETVE